jgi:glucose-1-phosphate adenylyltransferase
VLPRLIDRGGVRESRFAGYWRDMGTVEACWSSRQDLLAEPPPLDLGDPGWALLTRSVGHRAAARVLHVADVRESLLAPGARVAGAVERSVVLGGGGGRAPSA